MKLSEKTTTLLKNFSNINQSILFKKGNKLRTISHLKNILAEATVDENFPKDFGIYDLSQFLSGMYILKNPELDFENEKYVVIHEGKTKSKYFFSSENTIVTPPDKQLTLPSEDVSFTMKQKDLDQLLKAAGIYQLADLSVVGENGVVKLVVRDKKNDSSNDFSIVVGETTSKFVFNYRVENIKILPGTYEVVISKNNISRFTNSEYNLIYHIALEPDSTFE